MPRLGGFPSVQLSALTMETPVNSLRKSIVSWGRRYAATGGRSAAAGLVATATTLAVVASVALAGPASAATLSEQRSALRQITYAAAQDYVNARPYVPELARKNALIVKNAIGTGSASLDAASAQLTGATTQAAMDAAAIRVREEATRAATVRKVAEQLTVLVDYRTAQQSVATKALGDLTAARISLSTYAGAKDRTSAFTTQLAADSAIQLGAIGKVVPAPALKSAAWLSTLQAGSGPIPTVSGWVGFPGGCALPSATSTFTPVLPLDGPGVGTSNQLIANAKTRQAADATLMSVHAQMLRSATTEAARTLTLQELRDGYAPRMARLGYGWLSGSDTTSRSVLISDAKKILAAGPEGMNTLTSSHLLLAAATATNWAKSAGMEETALVRWLGPQTCLQADGENFVDAATNIAAIHNAANLVAAAVFLKKSPARAAALAKESLTSIQPALKMITTDGGTQEGPGYWTYQSRAMAVLYSTLPNLYATNPVTMPSLAKVSGYAMNSTDPNERPTPFADATPAELSPLMPAWDAHVRKDPAVAAWVANKFRQKPDAYLMWWDSPAGALPPKKSAVYPQTGFAALHIPAATATLKGGVNSANHAHLDLGTVSVFRRGVQWSVDPGAPEVAPLNYYAGPTRWTYWKPGTSAHSTLTVQSANQPTTAVAAITMPSASSAVVDLRQALPGTSSATRTVSHGSTATVIKDTMQSAKPLDLVWQWVTDASVGLGSDRAVLRRSGQTLVLRFTGIPKGSTLTAVPAPEKGPAGQALTIVKLSMPQVQTLALTTSAY